MAIGLRPIRPASIGARIEPPGETAHRRRRIEPPGEIAEATETLNLVGSWKLGVGSGELEVGSCAITKVLANHQVIAAHF